MHSLTPTIDPRLPTNKKLSQHEKFSETIMNLMKLNPAALRQGQRALADKKTSTAAGFSFAGKRALQTIVLALVGSATAFASPGLVGDSACPSTKVRSVGLGEVHWTDGFWAERFDLLRTNMLPSMVRLMEDNHYSQYFRNFEIAAGLAEGDAKGASFNDGDFYKLLEAESTTYAVTHDPALDQHLDRVIAVIAKAQRADGYIHTPVLIGEGKGDPKAVPFRERNNFEVYNMGHLMTAACVHHRATGKTNLLAVAIKAAGFLEQAFANPSPELARNSICPSHYMGVIELYRETGDPRYLELAKKFFAMRDLVAKGGDGGDDNQDRVPFLKQDEALGHAVRANYLFAGAADLFAETGDPETMKMLERVWSNVVEEKMYLTGGCGALYDGASPAGSKDQSNITRTHQAYGSNYQLPNTSAYNETCANIGNVLWNWRMFLDSGAARFVDVAELTLYNSVLSGVDLNGTNFFYTNPLRVTDPLPVNFRWSRTRVPYVTSFCCPPNVVRTIAEVGNLAYSKSTNAIWVNLYGGSELATELPGVGQVKMVQETEYPWSGRVRVKILAAPGKEFALKLRIPGWAKSASVRLNQQPAQPGTPESYFEIRREWKPGDVVDLDLPMPVRMMEANPLVEETLNQVAFQRGPVVYCLESPDLPKGVRLMDVYVPKDAKLQARFDKNLLGGVAVLEGTLLAQPAEKWTGKLYREVSQTTSQPVKTQLIPYYVWQNRGRSEMSVWLPLAPGK
jgi:uncharacterized protein